MSKFPLSKSRYVKGRQCMKYLWLYHHEPQLADPLTDFQEGIFRQGHEVGVLAHQLFPGGVLIDADHTQPQLAIEQTRAAIAAGATALYEGAFSHAGVLIRADIMVRSAADEWTLYEVKSASNVRKDTKAADLKPQFIQDIALQKWVLQNAGIKVAGCHLVHLNSKYVRTGDLRVPLLFSAERVDDDLVDELARVPGFVQSYLEALERPQPPVEIGSHCNNPYACSFKGHCWQHVGPYSVHRLTRISKGKREELADLGITEITDIPDDFELTTAQQLQRRAVVDEAPNLDRAQIAKFLKEFRGPLYFLDFETIGYAIPPYDGTRPYEMLVFQYSLHVQRGEELTHSEFFFDAAQDPSRACAERLIAALGTEGSIVVYHQQFEELRIKELAAKFADLAPALNALCLRMVDLETPFAKFWYCHPDFEGKSSIKKVLPVMVPSLSYDSLNIRKGDAAQRAYLEFLDKDRTPAEKAQIRQDLLEYCKLDTLAMVEILRALRALA